MRSQDNDGSPQRAVDALLAGCEAYERGEPLSACPFDPHTFDHDVWRRGYRTSYLNALAAERKVR